MNITYINKDNINLEYISLKNTKDELKIYCPLDFPKYLEDDINNYRKLNNLPEHIFNKIENINIDLSTYNYYESLTTFLKRTEWPKIDDIKELDDKNNLFITNNNYLVIFYGLIKYTTLYYYKQFIDLEKLNKTALLRNIKLIELFSGNDFNVNINIHPIVCEINEINEINPDKLFSENIHSIDEIDLQI